MTDFYHYKTDPSLALLPSEIRLEPGVYANIPCSARVCRERRDDFVIKDSYIDQGIMPVVSCCTASVHPLRKLYYSAPETSNVKSIMCRPLGGHWMGSNLISGPCHSLRSLSPVKVTLQVQQCMGPTWAEYNVAYKKYIYGPYQSFSNLLLWLYIY